MKSLMKKKVQKSSLTYTIFAFFLMIAMSAAFVSLSMLILWKQEEMQADRVASAQAGKIQYVIEHQLYIARTVEALLKQGNGEIEDFNHRMKEAITDLTIRNISLIPNGIVRQIYPYEGNEAAIGHDLFTDPERKTEALAARDSGRQTLSGPFPLRQGGYGAVSRLPIYLNDENGKEYFWGFVGIVLKFPQALDAAQMDQLEHQGYSYELWRVHPDTKEKQIISRSEKPLAGSPQEESLTLPNSTWTLGLTPKNGWLDSGTLLLRCVIALIVSILASLLFKSILELSRNRNELNASLRQQTANYRQTSQLNEELRIFRHDIKNHMLSLSSLLEREDLPQAKRYIAALSDVLTATTKIVNTENYIFDAILAEKTEKARSKNILVESEVLIGKQLNIRNADWSILFGNALDNAIEACEKVSGGAPGIRIFIQYTGNILQVRISNSSAETPLRSGKLPITTKSDFQNHGMGMKNIRAVVEKYDGVLDTKFENGIFTLSFLLFDV